jgi:predicted secreted hydrolase
MSAQSVKTMRGWIKTSLGILAVALVVAVSALLLRQEEPMLRAPLVALANEPTGYARVEGPQALVFPRDHGPHPDYQTEWWYYTGNLKTDDGRHIGYQLTFFRRAVAPPDERQARASEWATNQVYMAHFALTDVAGKSYQAFERFSRGAAGLAGAVAAPFRVWLDNWSVEEVEPGVVRMQAAQQDIALDLRLADAKGPILHGDGGYSQKGPESGNASSYYSLTRLITEGTVQAGGKAYPVRGLSWLDHEFSTSALAADQVGWDWFALQFDDGSELMVFQIRKADGSVDPFSSGTFITPDGSTRSLDRAGYRIRVEDTWRSGRTGATYPARWTIEVPSLDLTLRIAPYLADQELDVSYAYWEGAVEVYGEREGRSLRGDGYVEMTGYAGSMQGQF